MTFQEIEEHREQTAGLEYEESRDGLGDAFEGLSEDRLAEIEAYSMDDPKHPDYHSIHADIWDIRDKFDGLA